MNENKRLFGWHAAEAAVKHTPDKIVSVWLDTKRRDKRNEKLCQLLNGLHIKVQSANRSQLDTLSQRANHQGIVIDVELPVERNEQQLKDAVEQSTELPLFLILDQIQDPHNLGACFRTADATGVHGIIITKDRSADVSPTVYKVASGAVETVPLFKVTNLARIMEWLKKQGIWLIGMDGAAEKTVYETDLTLPLAIVIGAEGKGLRRLTKEHSDLLMKLPMYGQIESLNLSVATGVVLYEVVRQRSFVNV